MAFLRLSISFQILPVWECYAQISQRRKDLLQRRENLLVKAERVKHLRIDILVMSLGMVTQMLYPYDDYFCG